MKLLAILCAVFACAYAYEFDCSRVLTDFRDDERILEELKTLQKESGVKGVPMDCIQNLILGNHFESLNFAIPNSLATLDASELLTNAKTSINEVRTKLAVVREQVASKKQIQTIKMTPPFNWYQTLNSVYIEIKFAYRHDVSGCATLFNETIAITDDRFYMSAYCAETHDNNIFFELDFPFWAPIKSENMKSEKIPVGKTVFTLPKVDAPARWRHVYNEETKRPPTCKLNLQKLSEVFSSLYDFEDDEIENFEGWDLIEVEAEKDRDDMTWLFPTKGPGGFKKKGSKGKKKTGKKAKKSQAKEDL